VLKLDEEDVSLLVARRSSLFFTHQRERKSTLELSFMIPVLRSPRHFVKLAIFQHCGRSFFF
jgi:hypothetical protein